MKSYLSELYSEVWAVIPQRLLSALDQLKAMEKLPTLDMEAAIRPGPKPTGAVAVLPVQGFIQKRANIFMMLFGGTSTELLGQQIRELAADPGIKTIVLDIDSPGGSVNGVSELANIIMEARQKKPIVAVANSLAASAAYHIASAASDVVVTPDGLVGSIGVFTMHVDESKALEAAGITPTLIYAGKYKVEGNPFEPLGDDAKNAIQQTVDSAYDIFVADVAKGRGKKVSEIRGGFGQGRVVTARAAVAEGMADRVGTLRDVLSRLGVGTPAGLVASAETPVLEEAQEVKAESPEVELARRKTRLRQLA